MSPPSLKLSSTSSIAVFACGRIGLWEAVGAQVPFDTQVSAGPTAELFQLAKLLDDDNVDELLITMADCLKDHVRTGIRPDLVREQLDMFADA